MLRKHLLILILISIGIISYSQSEKKLAEAFIQSVAKNNFQLLDPYLVNAASAKTVFGNEFIKMPAAKQAEAIKKYKSQLQKKWNNVINNAKENKIDFNKVQLQQVLPGPIEGSEALNSLLITYQYTGTEWDDLLLIINKKGNSKYIIELPTDTRMFALNEDSRGKNLKDLQIEKDKSDPNIKQHLKDAVATLRKLVAANDEQQLYSHLVYTGEEDKDNRWKRTVDPSKPEDIQSAKRIIGKLKNGFAKCEAINYGEVRMEKESEGVWYVINTTCGDQKHTYAFLKINNTFVLGDSD